MEISFQMNMKRSLHYFQIIHFGPSHLILCLFSVSLPLFILFAKAYFSHIFKYFGFFHLTIFKIFLFMYLCLLSFLFQKVLPFFFFFFLPIAIVLCRGFLVHSSSKKYFVMLREVSFLLPACKPAGFLSVMRVSLASH